ncbi:MAG: hypothetical protein ABEJ79_09070 [Halolamina sp.]
MSETDDGAGSDRADGPLAALGGALAHAAAVTRRAARDPRAATVGIVVGGGYLLAYLLALGQLTGGDGGVSLLVVADPVGRALRRTALATFEPVARLTVGPVAWLVAPVNVAAGAGLGGLVGANAAVVVYARLQPSVCRAPSSRVGVVAGLPALLSGAACCGPTLLFALGVGGAGAFVGQLAALLPASAVLLVAGLVLGARSVTTPA